LLPCSLLCRLPSFCFLCSCVSNRIMGTDNVLLHSKLTIQEITGTIAIICHECLTGNTGACSLLFGVCYIDQLQRQHRAPGIRKDFQEVGQTKASFSGTQIWSESCPCLENLHDSLHVAVLQPDRAGRIRTGSVCHWVEEQTNQTETTL
jgi:hypothetical protein